MRLKVEEATRGFSASVRAPPGLHRVLDVQVLDTRAERLGEAVLLLQLAGEEPAPRGPSARSSAKAFLYAEYAI